MAAIQFNIAKGRINELLRRVDGNDPANSGITLVLLKVSESNATLQDYDTLAAVLGAAGNTEADFASYARIDLSDTGIAAPTVDDTANTQYGVIGDQTWSSATAGQDIVKLLVCYNPDITSDVDANIVPLTAHDFSVTTNGGDITADEPAGGFFVAS